MPLVVTECEPFRRLAWTTTVDGDDTGSSAYHGWVITPTGDGCHVLTEETQQGLGSFRNSDARSRCTLPLSSGVGGLIFISGQSPVMSSAGPSVWTGRALQVQSDDLEIIGLAHLYPALERNVCVPGHHGYPRALDLIRDSAPKAKWAT